MDDFVKLKFEVLSYENFVNLLGLIIFDDKGILSLKDVTYDYYPQLKEIEDYLEENKNDRKKVYKVIYEELEKTYRKYLNYSKVMIDRYQKIWSNYEKEYINMLGEYFNMEWPEGFGDITVYVGKVPTCLRFINDKIIIMDFMDGDSFVDSCMREILQFMFFMKCGKLFPEQNNEYDMNSLFWYMGQVVVDPILNNIKFRNIFNHKFKSYDFFYNIKFRNEMMMDKIHLIFTTNKIDDAFIECYTYLKKNEYEFRKQIGDNEKDDVIEVRLD